MRVLYDTNMLVAMLSRRESLLAFMQAVQQGVVIHVTSAYILNELESVLVKKLKLTKQKAKAAARLLARQSVIVHPQKIDRICRDPFDDYILAAAFRGRVSYLVTADKDLLVLEKYKSISIIAPNEFKNIFP